MPYVITMPCVGNKDTSCWEVCPVDAIHPSPAEPDYGRHDQLYINPVDCIECGACAPACPVEAIYADHEVPDEWQPWVEVNASYYERGVSSGDAA